MLDSVIKRLREYKKVIVTGPQRSGTTFAGQVIARRLRYRFLDEGYLEIRRKRIKVTLQDYLNNPKANNTVLQCPSESHLCHTVRNDEAIVVFMMRDVSDILASEKHMRKRFTMRSGPRGWTRREPFIDELRKYQRDFPELAKGVRAEDVCKLKYSAWEAQKLLGGFNYLELEYESLQEDKNWLPLAERRKRFKSAKQTS